MGATHASRYPPRVVRLASTLCIGLTACAAGAPNNDASLANVASGPSTGEASAATAWNQDSGDATTEVATGSGGDDDGDSGTSSDAGPDGTEGPAGDMSTTAGSSDDSGEESGGGVGDFQCPPGFVVAFDITDGAGDQMANHCGWLTDILFSRGSRISFEVWSASSDHYGPIIWDTAGYSAVFDDYARCQGPVTGLVSEDNGWRMSLIPTDSYVFVTAADDDPQVGDTHLYGWLATRHISDDEIFGIDEPYPGAWSTRYESGDRWVACYQP